MARAGEGFVASSDLAVCVHGQPRGMARAEVQGEAGWDVEEGLRQNIQHPTSNNQHPMGDEARDFAKP